MNLVFVEGSTKIIKVLVGEDEFFELFYDSK